MLRSPDATFHWPRLAALAELAAALVLSQAGAAAEWQSGPGHRWMDVDIAASSKPGFTWLQPSQTGITFTNHLADTRSITNQIYLNGSGVAAGDVDGDGLSDVFFAGIDGPCALYRNLGHWRFADVTATAGVACADQSSTGAALADVDGDGDLDLLVNGLGRGARLFLNDGRGRFEEATAKAGLGGRMGSTSLALADVDGDGDLDLYVANYRVTTLRDEPNTRFSVATANGKFELVAVNGRPVTSPDLVGRFTVDRATGVLEHGEADVLYRNEGGARFVPVSWTDGSFLDEDGKPSAVPYDWSLSAMFRDLNGDGAPDLIVCSDFQSDDRFWMNDGHGKFRAIPRLALRQSSLFSMGVDVADIDRDGNDDLFVADMLSREHALRQVQLGFFNPFLRSIGRVDSRPQYSRNVLFWNRGDGTYSEIAQLSGVEASDWTWCPVFLDVDLDGFEDLLAITGHARDAQNVDVAREIDNAIRAKSLSRVEQLSLRMKFPRLETPNFAFRNRGDLTFAEMGEAWGFNSRQISQGIALADFDNDGDLDVAINCLQAGPLLYRNDGASPRVGVRLRGTGHNRFGIGAKLTLEGGPVVSQSQEILCGGRYVSSDAPTRTFAAASGKTMRLTVRWRSGRQSVIDGVQANRIYEVDEAGASGPTASQAAPIMARFENVSAQLGHTHQDDAFDDLARQAILPHQLSQLGPGVTWFDLNGDGWEDLVVGAGHGGNLGVFLSHQGGRFALATNRAWQASATQDQTAILGWTASGGAGELWVGVSNYEDSSVPTSIVRRLLAGSGASASDLAATEAGCGPLALGDVDADGDLDLFVGGRARGRRYPEPVDSLLFRNDGGKLQLDAMASRGLSKLGLVSAALWSDLDDDGKPELVVACENGPVKVLKYGEGGFVEISRKLGLDRYVGWWNSVQAGDFDSDGKLDLVAGNWGRNTRYQSLFPNPLRIDYGDLNGDGALEVIQAYTAPELNRVVPWHDLEGMTRILAPGQPKFTSNADYAKAGLEEILGTARARLQEVQITTLDSMLFLNRGDHFEARPLPLAAQVSPAFGLGVADFNGDGCEDLLIAQNFFAVASDMSRHDAGKGLLLEGDGRGGFKAIDPKASGIAVYGEGRGLALADYDHDGRTDVAIGQNRGPTLLYHNRTATPGLRVEVRSPGPNPHGVGAVLRVRYADGRLGPARELHAGAGYWSQDAAAVVMGLAGPADAVVVRSPSGNTQAVKLPPGAKEVVVSP